MMIKLEKFILDFDTTWVYVKDQLAVKNQLSTTLLHFIDFKEGQFYTLMPNDVNLERLYKFEIGAILPQNPRLKGKNGSTYSITPDLVDELAHFISLQLQNNPKLWAFFEDVLRQTSNPSFEILPHVRTYGKQVYYALGASDIELPKLKQAIYDMDAIWHALGILTEIDIGHYNTELTVEQFVEIARGTELMIIGAYDGEGYVFWERNKGD